MAMKLRNVVEAALESSRFAVLATEGAGQPHASLIAITTVEGYRQLIFATYRSTRKFRNLALNGKVAVLFEVGNSDKAVLQKGYVITAFGNAKVAVPEERDSALNAHLKRHPELESFLSSDDCALIVVTVEAYQIVQGIDNVRWWPVDKLAES
ncbi:MAG: pyridoxamine 5'-phosphate oxidase family protein [Bacteroidales bacterium]|nr:pyridoxamine 5'-phosphate oxidase family protein [Bacteroidales bacterium]